MAPVLSASGRCGQETGFWHSRDSVSNAVQHGNKIVGINISRHGCRKYRAPHRRLPPRRTVPAGTSRFPWGLAIRLLVLRGLGRVRVAGRCRLGAPGQ